MNASKRNGGCGFDISEKFIVAVQADTLSEGNMDLLFETHSKDLEDECIGWLRERGYRCEIIDNAWWRFIVPEQRPGTPHNRWLWAVKV
jgi:hypothetical protein